MDVPLYVILALIAVESGGNDRAVGRAHERGCLQIKQVVVDDCNRFTGLGFVWDDAWDRERSIRMFRIYVYHYATRERLGREPTIQDAVRIWNGGPDGWRESATLAHWKKVRAQIAKDRPR